jgi:hypothetical protein
MFLKLLIISLVLMALAALGFGVRILLKSGGNFPDTHISHNKEMRKRGITCVQHNDVGCNPTSDYPGCASCGTGRLSE